MAKDYAASIDLDNENDPHTRLVLMTPEGSRVLDVGCSRGDMAAALKERGCRVTGVEMDPGAASVAEEICERVIVGDLDLLELPALLGTEKFDVVLFGDVLEHLKYPQRVLDMARQVLTDDGFIGVSVPNVAHGSIRLMLLKGEFTYEDVGILDDTHLRFYTRKSICDLLEGSGYLVDSVDWIVAPITERQLRETLDPLGMGDLEEVCKSFATPEAVARQYVIKAVPASEADRLIRLSEEKVRAEREVEELKSCREELKTSDVYARDLEVQIERKNAYIAQLEAALAERDRALAGKESGAPDSPGGGLLKRGRKK
jgi:2-polyprenyl-3-methyl-5-hydroxy-6-metoxy-1,4-benzoquinol methylase